MNRTGYVIVFIGLLILASCQASTSTTAPSPTAEAPTAPPAASPTSAETAVTPTTAARETSPDETPSPVPVTGDEPEPSLFPPTAADSALGRGNFFIDSAELVTNAEGNTQLNVAGSLPTPCHQLRADVQPPDESNQVTVTLYSVVKEGAMCTQVIKPFSGPVAVLPEYPAGRYTVVVNGQPVGDVTMP